MLYVFNMTIGIDLLAFKSKYRSVKTSIVAPSYLSRKKSFFFHHSSIFKSHKWPSSGALRRKSLVFPETRLKMESYKPSQNSGLLRTTLSSLLWNQKIQKIYGKKNRFFHNIYKKIYVKNTKYVKILHKIVILYV